MISTRGISSTKTRARALAAGLATTAALGVGFAALPGTAEAASYTPRNGVCEVGEVCLYSGYNRTGGISDHAPYTVRNLGQYQPGCYEYKAGSERGQCVKNNAMSAWNRATSKYQNLYISEFSDARHGSSRTQLIEHSGRWANFEPRLVNNAAGFFVIHCECGP